MEIVHIYYIYVHDFVKTAHTCQSYVIKAKKKKKAAIQHVSVGLAEQTDKTCMHMLKLNNRLEKCFNVFV